MKLSILQLTLSKMILFFGTVSNFFRSGIDSSLAKNTIETRIFRKSCSEINVNNRREKKLCLIVIFKDECD